MGDGRAKGAAVGGDCARRWGGVRQEGVPGAGSCAGAVLKLLLGLVPRLGPGLVVAAVGIAEQIAGLWAAFCGPLWGRGRMRCGRAQARQWRGRVAGARGRLLGSRAGSERLAAVLGGGGRKGGGRDRGDVM